MRLELKYGLLTALFLCVWVLIEYLLGFHNSNFSVGRVTGFFSIIIPIVTIFIALQKKKESNPNKNITFKEGLKAGFLVTIVYAVLFTGFLTVYYNYINPEARQLALEREKTQMIERGKTPEEAEQTIQENRAKVNDAFLLIIGFTTTIFLGMVITAIETIVLQKPQNPKKE
jgi:hypothetical protein